MRTGPQRYLFRRRRPAPTFLRTAQLNAVGYAALAGVCLAAGVVSALALAATGWLLLLRAVVGPVVVLAGLVVVDRRKWGRTETGYSFTEDAAETRRVAHLLIARGLPVVLDEDAWSSSLRYRNRDAARVHAALRELGITTF